MSAAPDNPPNPSNADRCRVCDASVPRGGEHAPFCSEHCRLVDLNNWFTGRYVVSREATPDDADVPVRRPDDS